MDRRTKILATIGPASEDPLVLRQMVVAGMDMARVSLAHGSLEEAIERVEAVREAAESEGRIVGVLADLPGPKIRTAPFPEAGVYLTEGDVSELVVSTDGAASNWERIAVDYPDLLKALRLGDSVTLGDGGIALEVTQLHTDRAVVGVVSGGRVQGRPGVGLPPDRTKVETPTAEDLRLLAGVCKAGVDAVAISFVQTAADIQKVRAAMPAAGGPMLIAKIETQSAVDDIENIIATSDGVMVARGDLGIRCALEDVPIYQKRIIRTGVSYGRPVITATQMLESMVHAPAPTRAEVSDVANAVFDGTSALMLSGETAIGQDPVLAVSFMSRIARRAEREFDYHGWGSSLGRQQLSGPAPAHVRITAAISAAAWRAANDAEATAIIACTNTGTTARAISRFRPTVPVVAATPSMATARQLSCAWGITPLVTDAHGTTDEIVWFAVEGASRAGIVKPGDVVAVLCGAPNEPDPTTDALRLVRVR